MVLMHFKILQLLGGQIGGQIGGQADGQADKKNRCINRKTKENSTIIVANLSASRKYIRN